MINNIQDFSFKVIVNNVDLT